MVDDDTLYITHTYLQFRSNIFLANFEARPKIIAENNCCSVALQSGSEILEAEWIQPLGSPGTGDV